MVWGDPTREETTVTDHLRPLERRVLTLRAQGHDVADIARRFRSSPEHMERVLQWAEIPRNGPSPGLANRAMEDRVLALLSEGRTHDDIARRFRRSAEFIRQVEGFAHYRRAMEILG
jgi:DNA-binding CsgD family transcriptional regulator